MGALAVTKDNTRIKGDTILRVLKTSHNPKLFHDVMAAKKSIVVGTTLRGKANTDEPVTGLIIEILHHGVIKNFRNALRALGGLLGGVVVLAVVDESTTVSGLDMGGLTC